jgi:predicted nucleic acid-binding protein
MIGVDANILISAVIGTTNAVLNAVIERDIGLFTTFKQQQECTKILTQKFGLALEAVDLFFEKLGPIFRILDDAEFENWEAVARARLHDRAQPDWPLLAAALSLDGGIWSHDRDFFGVGVPLWSTRNMCFAESE